jgi:hypothetical protein
MRDVNMPLEGQQINHDHPDEISKQQYISEVVQTGAPDGGEVSETSRASLYKFASVVLPMLVLLLTAGFVFYVVPTKLTPLLRTWLREAPVETGPASSATVTIVSASIDMKKTYVIFAITGVPDTSRRQVQARVLSSKLSQSKTARATGVGTTTGTHARGILTLHNSGAPITFRAGTIIGPNERHTGIQMELDETVTVDGDDVDVAAHVVQIGTIGNIPEENDTDGFWYCEPQPDCNTGAIGWTAFNSSSFSGGQNPQTYTTVQQSDMNGIVNQFVPALTSAAQDLVRKQIQPNEQPVADPQCTSKMLSNHAAGHTATTVTVSVTVTCTGEVYDRQTTLRLAEQSLNKQAKTKLGAGYLLAGHIATSLIQANVTDASRGTITLSVQAEGFWVYQFTTTQTQALAKQIVGKSKNAAQAFLLKQKGVARADIRLSGGDQSTLPTDTHRTRIVVLTLAYRL